MHIESMLSIRLTTNTKKYHSERSRNRTVTRMRERQLDKKDHIGSKSRDNEIQFWKCEGCYHKQKPPEFLEAQPFSVKLIEGHIDVDHVYLPM